MMGENKNLVPKRRYKEFVGSGAWEQRKLGEIANIYDGTHQTPAYTNDGVMFLSVENITTLESKKYISIEDFEKDFNIYPQKGDVLMTRIGDIGTASIVTSDEKIAYYVSLALLKPVSCDSEFLATVIASPSVQDELWKRTLHIAFPKKINKNEIAKVILKVPEFKEQEKIGDFFGQLDSTITLQQRKLEKMKALKDAYLSELFPVDGENKPKRRFKGFTEVWEQRKLGDVTLGHSAGIYIEKSNYGKGINILGVGDIYDSDVVDGRLYRLAPVTKNRYLLREGDLVYGESSLVPKGIARTVYVDKKGAGTAYAWHTRRVQVDNAQVNSHYLTLLLNYNRSVRHHLMSVSTQTALTGITTNEFFKTPITLPLKAEQDKISTLFMEIDNTITLHQRKLEKLQNLKSAYLNEMFAGGEK